MRPAQFQLYETWVLITYLTSTSDLRNPQVILLASYSVILTGIINQYFNFGWVLGRISTRYVRYWVIFDLKT